MELTALDVLKAVPVLTALINDRRAMTQRAKYRIARLHAKLQPEHEQIARRQTEIVEGYGCPNMAPDAAVGRDNPFGEPRRDENGKAILVQNGWKVPEDKLAEYQATLKPILEEKIAVDMLPVPVAWLSVDEAGNGAVEAWELIELGPLVTEDEYTRIAGYERFDRASPEAA